ncbi:MAG: hypothetical protein FWC71_08390 [Defluviitaleaceae bacterium]|nr:hypothetical protein [Defluviitaleaceae bacterium]
MKYRNVLATAALLGMLAVTGCSRGALPENNEANYNGERLVRSVSRHTNEVENRVENAAERTTRGVTRGINRNETNRHEHGRHDRGRQNRHTGIREGVNNGEINPHARTHAANRNNRGLNRAHNNHDVNNRNFANEARHDAERNRATHCTHRVGTPEYALHYDTNNEHSIPVSLTDEGTASFFKKNGVPKVTDPATPDATNATTPQPAQ